MLGNPLENLRKGITPEKDSSYHHDSNVAELEKIEAEIMKALEALGPEARADIDELKRVQAFNFRVNKRVEENKELLRIAELKLAAYRHLRDISLKNSLQVDGKLNGGIRDWEGIQASLRGRIESSNASMEENYRNAGINDLMAKPGVTYHLMKEAKEENERRTRAEEQGQ